MGYCLKKISIILLVILFSLSGCSNYRKSNPPQGQSNEEESNQIKKPTAENPPVKNASKAVILDAPIISQKPELKSGCEVTSLTMLLQYAGVHIDKMTLANKVKKDATPLGIDDKGNIQTWGDPNDGFVGDITGKERGFAVYPKPIIELMNQYLPEKGVDLTGQSFDALLKSIDEKRPVIIWATIDFKLPDKYEQWKKNGKTIKATFDEHAVLLVGYDEDNCYINNPYNGEKGQQVKKDTIISSWKSIGSMAVSYR